MCHPSAHSLLAGQHNSITYILKSLIRTGLLYSDQGLICKVVDPSGAEISECRCSIRCISRCIGRCVSRCKCNKGVEDNGGKISCNYLHYLRRAPLLPFPRLSRLALRGLTARWRYWYCRWMTSSVPRIRRPFPT